MGHLAGSHLCSPFAIVVLIFSALLVLFAAVAWLTVAHDAQLMYGQTLADKTGVSLRCFTICHALQWHLC